MCDPHNIMPNDKPIFLSLSNYTSKLHHNILVVCLVYFLRCVASTPARSKCIRLYQVTINLKLELPIQVHNLEIVYG